MDDIKAGYDIGVQPVVAEKVQVRVTNLGGNSVDLELAPDSTIAKLKDLIAMNQKVPSFLQKLCLDTEVLPDSYKIVQDSATPVQITMTLQPVVFGPNDAKSKRFQMLEELEACGGNDVVISALDSFLVDKYDDVRFKAAQSLCDLAEDVERIMPILCKFLQGLHANKQLQSPEKYTASFLKAAGYELWFFAQFLTVTQALEIGFTLQECSGIAFFGYRDNQLRKVQVWGWHGWGAGRGADRVDEWMEGGFTISALVDAGACLPELIVHGFKMQDLMDFGYTLPDFKAVEAQKALVDQKGELRKRGFTASQLKDIGFTLDELIDYGFKCKT